ncbi:hypothetical protein FISHEDRAFT_76836 [Fistulina hepatica ATCC 64428]|uniref:Protein BIG1 n=1 Tax=Fistulina hepatica ATCC 64428 TaxID=1128425 RepID=A0A0D7A449_9AGAR|nr:hypothetical protein FISHEDRAFT_76836 [Fistulina hepatica ATCC 64428]
MRTILFSAFFPLVFAFSDTFPVVFWSSHRSHALERLPGSLSGGTRVSNLLSEILEHDDVCGHDAVVIVDQPGIHASDLRALSPESAIARRISRSVSSRQYPYIPGGSFHLPTLASSVADRCESGHLSYTPGDVVQFEKGSKHVITLTMPPLEGLRMAHMQELDGLLEDALSKIENALPNYLIIYTASTPSHTFSRRQEVWPALDLAARAPANTTLASGGILKRYQLLTPALIISLLVSLLVLLPIIMFGIQALASIQSPVRLDAPKGFSDQQKKNQ